MDWIQDTLQIIIWFQRFTFSAEHAVMKMQIIILRRNWEFKTKGSSSLSGILQTARPNNVKSLLWNSQWRRVGRLWPGQSFLRWMEWWRLEGRNLHQRAGAGRTATTHLSLLFRPHRPNYPLCLHSTTCVRACPILKPKVVIRYI